jgi:RNase P/RNase MRP subunit p30
MYAYLTDVPDLPERSKMQPATTGNLNQIQSLTQTLQTLKREPRRLSQQQLVSPPPMFYDLNVAVDPAQREDAARTCARLGFDVIAFNTTVNVRKLGAEHMPPPLPDLSKAMLPHDAGALRVSDGHARGRSCIRVLNRITLVVDDPAQLATLGSPVLGNFDLVAVAPGSEKLFQQCLQFDFDIIALRFASKQQFYLKRPQLHVAAEKVGSACTLVFVYARRSQF